MGRNSAIKSDRMHFIAIFALLTASALADYSQPYYSFSNAAGSGGGTSFSLAGGEPITAVRLWENFDRHIYGIQLRFGFTWSAHAGVQSGSVREFELRDHEVLVQISGKYSHYINSLVFVTNHGRTMWAGMPSGLSFNMYPAHRDGQLIIISGRFHGGLTALGSHWAVRHNTSANMHM